MNEPRIFTASRFQPQKILEQRDTSDSYGKSMGWWSIAFGGLATNWFKFSMDQPKYTATDVDRLDSPREIPQHASRFSSCASEFIHSFDFLFVVRLSFGFAGVSIELTRHRITEGNCKIRLKIPLPEALQLWNYYAVEMLLVVERKITESLNYKLHRGFLRSCETTDTQETARSGKLIGRHVDVLRHIFIFVKFIGSVEWG